MLLRRRVFLACGPAFGGGLLFPVARTQSNLYFVDWEYGEWRTMSRTALCTVAFIVLGPLAWAACMRMSSWTR